MKGACVKGACVKGAWVCCAPHGCVGYYAMPRLSVGYMHHIQFLLHVVHVHVVQSVLALVRK